MDSHLKKRAGVVWGPSVQIRRAERWLIQSIYRRHHKFDTTAGTISDHGSFMRVS